VLIRKPSDIRSSEITSETNYVNRRQFLQTSALAGGSLLAGSALSAIVPDSPMAELPGVIPGDYSTTEAPNSVEDIVTYNNYYEFGTGKSDPVNNSQDFEPRPWTIEVSGHADITGTFDIEDFIKPHTLEERIYRMRCVEAWSMVIPWYGFPLSQLIDRVEPTANAKYVQFKTIVRPSEMPGQRRAILNWPYVEGLRMDEAMHPLAFLVVGMYGRILPNQNGAPIRLMIPWKYGFKTIKSIVRIHFSERQPHTSWNDLASDEYGFYANVNPEVAHPRWSQARERRLGEYRKRPTLPFNGYGDQVASLYAGMDLHQNF